MRVLFLLPLFVWVLPILTTAQQKQGTIVYETRSTSSLTINGVTQQLPTKISKTELLFADGKSVFRNIPSSDEDQQYQKGSLMMSSVVDNSLRVQYHDFEKNERRRTADLGTTSYIVSSQIPDFGWTVIPDQTKIILNHRCTKAVGKMVTKDLQTSVTDGNVTVTRKIDTVIIYSWFTTDILQPLGPGIYTGLPGAILQVLNAKDKVLYEAVSIKETVKLKDIQTPSKGKRIGVIDFEEIEKKYKEESTREMNKRY